MTEEELDKLAEAYQDDNTIIRYYDPGNGSVPEYNKTMAEVFKDARNACKRHMMRESVETVVVESYGCEKGEDGKWKQVIIPTIHTIVDGCLFGDKVRVIIVKEEN